MDSKLVPITVTGTDRPGMITAVKARIAEAGARIRDIEPTVTHTLHSVAAVIDSPTATSSQEPLTPELLYLAKKLEEAIA